MKKQRQTFKLAWNTILLLIYRSATESSKYSRALFKHCNQAEITHRGTRPPLKTHSAPCWADRGVERKSKRKLAVFTSDWLRRAGAEAWTRHQYTWDDVRNAWQPMLGEKEQPPPHGALIRKSPSEVFICKDDQNYDRSPLEKQKPPSCSQKAEPCMSNDYC